MFIGEKEIEGQIPSGDKNVFVTYKDGSSEIITKLMYDASITEEPLDPSALRDHQMKPIIIGIISLLLEYDVKASDVQYITALVITSLQEWEVEADKKLWNGVGKRQIKISDIDKVLKGM